MPSWREDERLHDLNDLLFFASVVKDSGFSAAARSLNLPKSSVSRHVGRLEDRLGVRLLERSTRNVRLTEIGSSYYARCKAILSELETAEQDLALLRSDPIGTIRDSCPTGLAHYALARIVPGFLAHYPFVRAHIIATNRAVHALEATVNLAFSWKLLVLERGSLSYRLKLPCDRSEKDAWFEYSPAGALRKLPFILYSRPAEDWLQRSGSSSTISPTTLFFAISARGRHN